jgi:hypothetical protein
MGRLFLPRRHEARTAKNTKGFVLRALGCFFFVPSW